MFPYPSGDLHMGHAEAYALGDVIARYWVQRGFNVMHPIGWDAFGLPAENAAIKRGVDPARVDLREHRQQKASMRRYACSFDWDRVLNTCDPEYYRWNQWLFLRLFERGLAYRKASAVNWCPNDQTVLANEQVVGGLCERCDTPVTKKKLTQWYFKITDYADRLLDDMAQLEGHWPDKVLPMQRNWIGRSTGADVAVRDRGPRRAGHRLHDPPGHPVRRDVLRRRRRLRPGRRAGAPAPPGARRSSRRTSSRSSGESEIDRLATERPKTGVFLQRYAVNPVNGERLPIYAADYVLADYGTGAIMAVPAHDQRDLDFARAFGLPVRVVVEADDRPAARPAWRPPATARSSTPARSTGCARPRRSPGSSSGSAERGPGPGRGQLPAARLADLAAALLGHADPDRPLPGLRRGAGAGRPAAGAAAAAPRASTSSPRAPRRWARPTTGSTSTARAAAGRPRRDTDTMDTFVDSSWYFLRYLDPAQGRRPVRPGAGRRVDAGRPVRRRRHPRDPAPAVRRFFTKVLHDLGMLDFTEPFTRLLNQGMVADGRLGDEQVARQPGAAVRRAGRPRRRRGAADAWCSPARPRTTSTGPTCRPAGSEKFLARALAAVRRRHQRRRAPTRRPVTSRCAARPTGRSHDAQRAVESFRFNVAVARTMELVNATRKAIDSGVGPADPAVREAAEAVAIMLSLVAPYTAEEMWERLGHEPTVALAGWPAVDPALLVAGVGHLRRAGRRQGARPARGGPGHRRGRAARAGAGHARRWSRPLGGRGAAHGDRAGAEAGQRRPGLISA